MKPTRNLWPLGIISAFAIFISGTIALIVVACCHRMDLVSSDYYDQEIKFQGHLDRLNRTRHLANNASVAYYANKARLIISLPSDEVRTSIKGHIQLYRPSASGLDRQVALVLDANGTQSLDVSALRPGLWKVRVSWTTNEKEFFLDQSIIVSPKS